MTEMIFTAMRILPAWSLPLGFIMYEMAVYFRRKGSPLQVFFWAVTASLLGITILWIVYRGDVNSDNWVKSVLGM